MKLRLRTKTSISFLGCIMCCMFVLNSLTIILLEPIFVYDSKKQMMEYSTYIKTSYQNNREITEDELDNFNEAYLISTIIVKDNQIVSTSLSNKTKKEVNHRLSDLIQKCEKTEPKELFIERYDDDDNITKLLYVFRCGDSTYGIMKKPIKGIEQNVKIVLLFLLLCEVFIAIAGLVIWNLCTRKFTETFEKIKYVANHVANLKFDDKVDYCGNDYDLQDLSKSIDNLSEKLQKNVEHLEKEIEEKKMFLRNVSHEIKTPLTTIKGYAENIKCVSDDERISRYCDVMVEECEELDFLANEMLNATTVDAMNKPENRELLTSEQIITFTKLRVETYGDAKRFQFEYDPFTLYFNKSLIRWVLTNYLDNAVKYSKEGYPIEVKAKETDGQFVFSVSSYGTEIHASEREMIWNAFYRCDKSRTRGKGYGIGLAIVKDIALMCGGAYGVKSDQGKNTFYFCLPKIER